MNEEQKIRYSRHILLKDLGYEGQDKIANSHVLVIGAGGLGSPATMYLASGGFGKLTLVDNDQVELTNLQRQILHSTDRIGKNKAESGKQTLTGINPTIDIVTITDRMEKHPCRTRQDCRRRAGLYRQFQNTSDYQSCLYGRRRSTCVRCRRPV